MSAAITKGNPRSSGYAREPFEWYVEPNRAIADLLHVEKFNGVVVDPACGKGTIPLALRDAGYEAYGSDIVDRADGMWPRLDFFNWTDEIDNCVTNPPFLNSMQFTLHALSVTRYKVAILQRLTWLEGQARGRALFDTKLLAKVWVFRTRISMPPGRSDIKATNGAIAYAWFVFDKQHVGPTTLGWLP